MPRKNPRAPRQLDGTKRQRVAVTQIKVRIQALKFTEPYRAACRAFVEKYGATTLWAVRDRVRERRSWAESPDEVEADLHSLMQFPLEGLTPVDPLDLDDFDPAVEQVTVLSNAVRIGTDADQLAGWIDVAVNPRCTEEEWRAAYPGYAESHRERLEALREWDADLGPGHGFRLLAMSREGSSTEDLVDALREWTRSVASNDTLRTYWYRMRDFCEAAIAKVEEHIVRVQRERELAEINEPWQVYLRTGVVPRVYEPRPQRPAGEVSPLYRVTSPYQDPSFSL
jgi:hypothetical protein